MRARLGKLFRLGRNKTKVSDSCSAERASGLEKEDEIKPGASDGDNSLSRSDCSDSSQSIPFHVDVKGATRQLVVAPIGMSQDSGEESQQLSNFSTAPFPPTRSAQQHPRDLTPVHPARGLLSTSNVATPTASPAYHQPPSSVLRSARSARHDSSASDCSSSAHSSLHHGFTGSRQGPASASVASLGSSAPSEERRAEQRGRYGVARRMEELESLVAMPRDVNRMFGPEATRRQLQNFAYARAGVDMLAPAQANDLAAFLSSELNLQSLSEAWARGLQAHDEPSTPA